MTVQTTQIDGEPIIITTFSGNVVIDDIYAMYDSTLAFQQQVGGVIYRISYMGDITTDFPTLMQVLRTAAENRAGSGGDPNVRLVFAGTSVMARMIKDALTNPQFGGVNIPLFAKVDDALEYIRITRAEEEAESTSSETSPPAHDQ